MIKIFFLALVLFCAVSVGFTYHASSGLEGHKLEYNAQLQALLLQGFKYEQATSLLTDQGIHLDDSSINDNILSFVSHAVDTIEVTKWDQ
ncbi:MAG: hypothetical protein AB8G05_00480 [Oligoflexales bacterium]